MPSASVDDSRKSPSLGSVTLRAETTSPDSVRTAFKSPKTAFSYRLAVIVALIGRIVFSSPVFWSVLLTGIKEGLWYISTSVCPGSRVTQSWAWALTS
ncbi:MAG: hypothetical protein UX06_C0047G0005 [Candidatus Giovannonibacteria bacterium GW2011_GWA2_45_21]|uniref:Uncharacterized protein n=1 Tax=Candidatus Giovannonibacteria bacterium GW2011_GWA2_45_21 TaxID=1618649 RepID=A0A0G1PC46_9BACT|nr:MAG: hypothetical protein UX06_C0047G0005 [Candidatus Giovannonibacteria bacterium GW2011_GWA2_45_21]